MRNVIAVLLILAVAVGWFSAYGPREAVDGSGLGPGDDRAGENPLVVAGPGAGIVAVAEAPAVAETHADREQDEVQGREVGTEAPEEGIVVDWTDVALFLAGAEVMLVGLVVSPVAAWLWRRAEQS